MTEVSGGFCSTSPTRLSKRQSPWSSGREVTRRAVPKDAAALQVFSESRQTVVQNRSLQLRFDPQERFPPATRTAYDLGAVMVGTDGNR